MSKNNYRFWNDAGSGANPLSGLMGGASGGSKGGASPTGAIAQAAASVINNTVDNLFMNKVYKSEAELNKAKADAELMKQRLALLNSDQQNVLATQLQQMNDDNAKTKLLNDMVVAISTAQLNSSQYDVNEIYIAGLQGSNTGSSNTDLTKVTANAAGNQIKLAVIVLVAAVIVVAAAMVFKKNNN